MTQLAKGVRWRPNTWSAEAQSDRDTLKAVTPSLQEDVNPLHALYPEQGMGDASASEYFVLIGLTFGKAPALAK